MLGISYAKNVKECDRREGGRREDCGEGYACRRRATLEFHATIHRARAALTLMRSAWYSHRPIHYGRFPLGKSLDFGAVGHTREAIHG